MFETFISGILTKLGVPSQFHELIVWMAALGLIIFIYNKRSKDISKKKKD